MTPSLSPGLLPRVPDSTPTCPALCSVSPTAARAALRSRTADPLCWTRPHLPLCTLPRLPGVLTMTSRSVGPASLPPQPHPALRSPRTHTVVTVASFQFLKHTKLSPAFRPPDCYRECRSLALCKGGHFSWFTSQSDTVSTGRPLRDSTFVLNTRVLSSILTKYVPSAGLYQQDPAF